MITYRTYEYEQIGRISIPTPQVGLEPTTLRLTAECSTIELLRISRASWIRTNEMRESKSRALPLGDSPII